MILKNIKANQKDRGFTIVELLVVIVVIGILAAITIVSYTGVTARANGSAAKSGANNIMTKATTYQTDNSAWPTTLAAALSSTTSAAALTGYTMQNASAAVNAASTTAFSYQLCGSTNSTVSTAAPASLAALTGASGIPTGVVIGYWDYASTPAQATVSAGAVSGTNPYVSGGTTYNNTIACFYTAT